MTLSYNPKSKIQNAKAGFTLIELLVVVAIIAVLISILLPAIQSAREEGRKAVCGSNLRSTGVAIQMYTNDNRDFFPQISGDPSGPLGNGMWNIRMHTLKYLTLWGVNIIKPSPMNVLSCPSRTYGASGPNGVYNYYYDITLRPHYGAMLPGPMATVMWFNGNWWWGNQDHTRWPSANQSRISEPSRLCLMGELLPNAGLSHVFYETGSYLYGGWFGGVHNKKDNLLYTDLHVKADLGDYLDIQRQFYMDQEPFNCNLAAN